MLSCLVFPKNHWMMSSYKQECALFMCYRPFLLHAGCSSSNILLMYHYCLCSNNQILNKIEELRSNGYSCRFTMQGFVRLCWPVPSPGSWQPFWLFQTPLADGGPVPALLQGLLWIERETEMNVLPLYLCCTPGTSPSQGGCQCQCVQIC